MAKRKAASELKPEPSFEGFAGELGNRFAKIRAGNGLLETFSSVQGRASDQNSTRELPFESTVILDGVRWVFGDAVTEYAEAVDWYQTLERYTSAWYKRLFAFSLHRAYGQRIEEGLFYPKVALTIPPEVFKSKKIVGDIKKMLSGTYQIGNVYGGCLQIEIKPEYLHILPEGAPGLMYMIEYGATNGQTIYGNGVWLVIDNGGLTGSITAYQDGRYIGEVGQSDPQSGMMYIARKIADMIREQTGHVYDPAYFDTQLACDSVPVPGNIVNIAAVRNAAVAHVTERLNRMIEAAGRGRMVQGILQIGGGAAYITLTPHGMPAVIKSPIPRTIGVEGLYQFLVAKYGNTL